MKKALASLICVSLLCLNCQRQNVEQRPSTPPNPAVISEVRIAGNKRISTDTIKSKIQTQSGQPFNEVTISGDIERLRALGEFDDVRIEDGIGLNGGRILTFQVYEKFPKTQ